MNVIELLILIVAAGQLLVIAWLVREILRTRERISRFFKPDGEKLSEFGVIVDGVSEVIGTKIKAALMGMISGNSRLEKAAERELVEVGMQKANPGLYGILGSFPRLRKFLTKNTDLAQLALDGMAKIGNPGNNSNPIATGGNKPWKPEY